jgi:Tfp pilus assembly protein PilO
MRVRDRLVVAVIVAALIAGAMWVLVVSPERSQVSSLSTQITTARASLVAAQTQLARARSAAAGYVDDVHQISEVMTAIPPAPGEAALIRTITRLAGTKVDVHELDLANGGATPTGPVALGLSFTFDTSYHNLQNFLAALDALTTTDGSKVNAHDRLFTVGSVSLVPLSPTTTKASVTGSAYIQGAAAVAPAPAGATSPTGTTG